MTLLRPAAAMLAFVTAVLFAVSIYGDLAPLPRHPLSLATETHKKGLPHHRLTSASELGLERGMTADEFALRIGAAIRHKGTEHRQFDADQAYGFAENWMIWAATRAELFVTGALGSQADLRFAHVERFDPDLILQMGVGLCGQVAILGEELLEELGYQARAVGLDGHVVVEARLDSGYWIIDPDYGVAIPGSLREIEADPQRVAAAYRARGYSERRAEILIGIYGPEGNQTDGRYIGDTQGLLVIAEILEHLSPILGFGLAALIWFGAGRRRTAAMGA